MSVVNQIIAALRDGAKKSSEAVVDTQALRAMQLEIRTAEAELKRSRDSLDAIVARQTRATDKAARLLGTIGEQEQYVRKALEQGEDELAHEVATRIAKLESEVACEREAERGFQASADELRAALRGGEDDLRHMKQQVDVVRASEAVQRAQQSVSARDGGDTTTLRTAMESLERIKQRQTQRAASSLAAREMAKDTAGRRSVDSQSLDARLEAAGIKPAGASAEAVLERLKRD